TYLSDQRFKNRSNQPSGDELGLVLGVAGSGKTTTILKFAREAARRSLENPSAAIPLLPRLSTWHGSSHHSFTDWLANEVRLLASGLITRLLDSGRALLLLDGLEEVRWRKREPAETPEPDPRHELLKLIPRGVPLVITCRQREAEQLANEGCT